MKTDQDRLAWIVEKFIVSPIKKDTRRRIRDFLTLRRSSILTNTDDDPDEMSDADVRRLQGEVAAVLGLFIDGEGLMTTIAVEKQLLHPRAGKGKRQPPVLLVTGPLRDVFLEVVYHLLASVPADQVRRCPGCRVMFVRTGRQTHCTTACYDSHHWANLPQEKLERYRRNQYEKEGWTRGARTHSARGTAHR